MLVCLPACLAFCLIEFSLGIQDEFLVLASDGLFDVMDDQSVIDTVGNYLKEYKR